MPTKGESVPKNPYESTGEYARDPKLCRIDNNFPRIVAGKATEQTVRTPKGRLHPTKP